MIDLTTNYLGLTLKNPLVPSSSPLTANLDDVRRLEDAGAAAIVLPSLFEESVHQEQKQLEKFVQNVENKQQLDEELKKVFNQEFKKNKY